MKTTFKIVELIETGEKFLAKPSWFDPSSKWTLFAEYKENEEPIFGQWGINNEYRSDVKIVGNYETDKINFSWENGIEYIESV